MDIEDVSRAYNLSAESILERVDEYTLYCKYLGFEPMLRTRYNSFIRTKDEDPSFSLFESTFSDREYTWKDSALGESGEIFKLIRLMFNLKTAKEAYAMVDVDFNLGYGSNKPYIGEKIKWATVPQTKEVMKIAIKTQEFTKPDMLFWNSFGVSKTTLKIFNVNSLKFVWYTEFQPTPALMSGLAFSYRVNGKYKIYRPYNKKYKWRNDFDEKCLEGFAQLKYRSDTLIITKSLKDVMVLYELGFEAVAVRSENTMMPYQYMSHFNKKYKRILILFDNDMKHNGEEYLQKKIYVPIDSGTKDISDYRRRYGFGKALYLMNILTQQEA